MTSQIKQYWSGLQQREQLVLLLGVVVVAGIIFYATIWRPWHIAINAMEAKLPKLRTDLIWMQQQSEQLKASEGSLTVSKAKGADQSLLSVIEQTAKRAKVSSAIQQMVPNRDNNEVRVVLDGVNFNQWVRWIDELFKQYGVNIKQVTAERDEDKPNTAEIRLTFVR